MALTENRVALASQLFCISARSSASAGIGDGIATFNTSSAKTRDFCTSLEQPRNLLQSPVLSDFLIVFCDV